MTNAARIAGLSTIAGIVAPIVLLMHFRFHYVDWGIVALTLALSVPIGVMTSRGTARRSAPLEIERETFLQGRRWGGLD